MFYLIKSLHNEQIDSVETVAAAVAVASRVAVAAAESENSVRQRPFVLE